MHRRTTGSTQPIGLPVDDPCRMGNSRGMVRAPIEVVTEAEPLAPSPAFLEASESFGIQLEPLELERLGRFLALLLANNQRMNLTAIRDEDDQWMRHGFDALTLMAALAELEDGQSVVDVGSGSGVPALPLAIARPDLRFTLIETTGKKATFLARVAEALGLEHVQVIADRAETVGRSPQHREQHDLVIARAVAPLRVLVELCSPLIRVEGRCAFIKGGRADEELKEAGHALRALHLDHVGTLETPTGKILLLDKSKRTGKRYPRRPGEPKRAPL